MRKYIVTAVFMLTLCSFAANAKTETRQETAASYIQLGDKFAHTGDLDRAIGAYNIALQFDPDSAFAFLRRGCAFEGRGDVASRQLPRDGGGRAVVGLGDVDLASEQALDRERSGQRDERPLDQTGLGQREVVGVALGVLDAV